MQYLLHTKRFPHKAMPDRKLCPANVLKLFSFYSGRAGDRCEHAGYGTHKRRAFTQAVEVAIMHCEQINQALANYQSADQQLTGKTTDFSSLKKLIAAELQFQAKNAKFIYAADKVKVNYLQAFIRAQAVLANPGASQQEVKAALAEVKAAKKKLNGKKPKVAKRP